MFGVLRRRREALRGAVAAVLVGAESTTRAGADSLVIENDVVKVGALDGSRPDGTIAVKHGFTFGHQLAAQLTLYEPGYTIGIQPNTMYFRTDNRFAWFKDGRTNSEEMNADGGVTIMSLSESGLSVAGTVTAKSIVTESGASLAALQSALNMLIPIGTVMAFGGDTTIPDVKTQLRAQGWLPCDGAELSKTEYPALYQALGTAFGVLNQNFRVPDLRGRFLRGTDQRQ